MKIILGMSGGLDSTYSLELLKNAGHTVEGAVLRMHDFSDIEGAKESAEKLQTKLHIVDCRKEFDEEIKTYFIEEYANGRTPNPCTVCNRKVKFSSLIALADKLGFDKVATGHYAGIKFENGRYFISKPKDLRKEQTYMLWNLRQDQLSRIIFPLTNFVKTDIREKAREIGIKAADRPESQDICFLPDGNYAEYIESRIGKAKEGNFIDANGKILGRHKGLLHYTIGQRRGLGIALGERMFVSKMNPVDNTITLLADGGAKCTEAEIRHINFQKIYPQNNETEFELNVKIRYAAPPVKCKLTLKSETQGKITFYSPIKAVTPGQSAVFYDDFGDLALGGVFD